MPLPANLSTRQIKLSEELSLYSWEMNDAGTLSNGSSRRFPEGTVISGLINAHNIMGTVDFRIDGERYKFRVLIDSALLEGPDRKANLLGGSRRSGQSKHSKKSHRKISKAKTRRNRKL